MPLKCPIAEKEYHKQWMKQWRKKNPEKVKEYNDTWKKNNPEKLHKSNTISHWIRQGTIDEDISSVYDYFITQTHCWICGIEYCKKYKRCLDHNHDTGEIRYICCAVCNSHVVG